MTKYHWFTNFAILFALIANVLFIQSSIFAAFLAVAYLASAATSWSRLFSNVTRGEAKLYGLLVTLCGLSLVGAIVYKLFALNDFAVLVVLALILFAPSFLQSNSDKILPTSRLSINTALWWLAACLLTIFLNYFLFSSGTYEAIRSPWQVVNNSYWIFLFVFWLIWITGLSRLPDDKPWYVLPAFLALAIFNLYDVALIIYKIGFGFDPFIHIATEKLIANTGTVSPKPWYYLGQYSLVVIFHKLSMLPVELLDKVLLISTAVLSLPILISKAVEKNFTNSKFQFIAALTVLIPASFLISTTPQGLANLIFLAIILLAWTHNNTNNLLLFLAVTATLIHPIAGIPAILFVLILFINKHLLSRGTLFSSLVTILAVPVIPVLFWLQNNQLTSGINLYALPSVDKHVSILYLTNRFNLLFDTIYQWHWNGFLLLIILIIGGAYLAYKNSQKNLIPFGLISAYLFANWLILSSKINFNFLINYERSFFSDRFLTLGIIAALPFIYLSLHFIATKLFDNKNIFVRQFSILSFAVLACITVYTIYPRFDAYQYDRGYSTSAADIEAVKQIHTDANGENYVVLANQAVSAAALQELGFYKYYSRTDENTGEQIFFYPIPTGGSLYQIYLEMVYDAPTKAVAEKAMTLTGVDTVYFVLNEYWFNSEILNEIASSEADEVLVIEDEIYIYKFIIK